MSLPPVGRKGEFDPIFDPAERQDPQPESIGNDSVHFAKTAAKFQLDNVPKALKNTAKFIMKVLTAPPALALDLGGGVLKNVGFFIRALPMALGGAIGEKINPKYELVGQYVGFAIASPITIPALAIEMLGKCAKLAGSLHIRGNIKEEFDMGVYLKRYVLSKSPATIRDEYVKELRMKDPTISEEKINEKIQFKFRNQEDRLKNIKYNDYKRQVDYTISESEEEEIDELENLQYRFEKVGNVTDFVNSVGDLAEKESEKMNLSPETTKERVNNDKTEALIYCMNMKAQKEEKLFFWIENGKYEFRNDVLNNLQRNIGLTEESLKQVREEGKKIAEQLEGEAKLEKKKAKAEKAFFVSLDAHVNRIMTGFEGVDNKLLESIKQGAVKSFLDRPVSKLLLKDETFKKMLKAHCQEKLGVSLDIILST